MVDDASQLTVLRDRLVEAGWQRVELLERMDHSLGNRVTEPDLAAHAAHAAENLEPLERWRGVHELTYSTYLGAPNQVRMRRVLDVLVPGERIVDVGIGFGYLTAVVMRTGLVEHYTGIDLRQRYVGSTIEALRHHGLPLEDVHLEVLSLYDITPEWMGEQRPTLVTLFEVLEHVPDVARALQVLGDAIADGVSVLFTVPMLGRLEGVWGHASVFDRDRVTALCQSAGLTIQYVEPLYNHWIFVLATKGPGIPEHLSRLARAPEVRPQLPPRGYVFEPVPLDEDLDAHRRRDDRHTGETELESVDGGVRARVTGGRRLRRKAEGGLGFPVRAPQLVRLQAAYEDPEAIAAVWLDAYDGEGARVGQWRWTFTPRGRARERPITHVIKATSGGRFKPIGTIDMEAAQWMELGIELKDGAQGAAVRLLRAAYIGAP